MSAAGSLEERLASVRAGIERAARAVGRDPAEVTLIAVSKGFAPSDIEVAHSAGQRDFGENRVGEMLEKRSALPDSVRWHFIGRLQRNKVKRLLQHPPVVHSVDSRELAAELDARATGQIEVLIEVNVSGESQKGGVPPGDLAGLVEFVVGRPHLELTGLMTMAPRAGDPNLARPLFARLAELRYEMNQAYSCAGIHHLSMGMSQDYLVAVEEGSTMVRVGEAIFGPRPPYRRAPLPRVDGGDQVGKKQR